eukprot:gene17946-19736_t
MAICCGHSFGFALSSILVLCHSQKIKGTNKFTNIPAFRPDNNSQLYLEECNIKNDIPGWLLERFPYLRYLRLSHNHLTRVPDLSKLRNLNTLVLSANNIKSIRANTFTANQKLKTLSLESNKIRKVNKGAFTGLPSLLILKLNSNNVKALHSSALKGLHSLTTLHLKNNKLRSIPTEALKHLKRLSTLTLENNKIQKIPPYAFSGFSLLKSIDVWNRNDLTEVAYTAFSNMASLTKLKIECNNGKMKLDQFPDLTGTLNLKELDLAFCNLPSMPENFCANRSSLITLKMLSNRLKKIPNMKGCKNLKFLDLEHNQIESLGNNLEGLKALLDLDAGHNHINMIGERAFHGLRNLDLLDLSHNLIKEIHPRAFGSFKHLKRLSLESNKLKHLPTLGLHTLTHINTRGNIDLIEFPEHSLLPNIKKLVLHYPYHCCYYRRKQISEEESVVTKALHSWVFTWSWGNDTADTNSSWAPIDTIGDSNGQIEPMLPFNSTVIGDDSEQTVPDTINPGDELKKTLLECQPQPNVFYPCDNLMTKQWLRICVWFVFLLALIGNSIVLFVIFANCSKFDVQRFLTLNLAFADLMLGIYLGFLAVVDIVTYGNFRAKALQWQFSPSCKAAGFIAVLASELSVFTLTVITVERFITIKYSMYIHKQMSVTKAVIIMIFGWIFCIVLALLPIIRINTEKGTIHFSDYTKYSVCLPFDIPEKESPAHMTSMVYLSFVLFFNIIAFSVIVFCYIKIFLSVRGSGAFNSGDSRVAKRVALLVFTDFACWFPICIVALTAVYGSPVVKDLWLTKVFTVFILPLNACANPFLYAIFTKQFHKDCWAMYRQMKIPGISFSDRVNRKLGSNSSKLRPKYQAFRRGSSCSFPIGRRSSTRCDELRMSSRSTYKTPMNTDDERERGEKDERDDRMTEFHEKETCL